MSPAASHKIALVMGVANQRSIAWNCVESLVHHGWKVIFTYQSPKMESRVRPLLDNSKVLGAFACDVVQDMPEFSQRLSDLLEDRPLHAVVHSLAHAPNLKTNSLLNTTLEDYMTAQHISAYSLIDIARETQHLMTKDSSSSSSNSDGSSITALTYLGAVRAIPGYNAMGPAKATLESIVRGLALELAVNNTRVNAVSAGPLPTLAAKGGIANFDSMRQDVAKLAPLGNVTSQQVADTVSFLASASGITGQTIYVDGGYSIVGGPPTSAGVPSSTEGD
jgi:enoyl-[acyl-carrier protein] reductase I